MFNDLTNYFVHIRSKTDMQQSTHTYIEREKYVCAGRALGACMVLGSYALPSLSLGWKTEKTWCV